MTTHRCEATLGPADLAGVHGVAPRFRYEASAVSFAGPFVIVVAGLIEWAPLASYVALIAMIGSVKLQQFPGITPSPGPVVTTADELGVRVEGEALVLTATWPTFDVFTATDQHIALGSRPPYPVVTVPRRGFASPADADRFAAFAESRIGADAPAAMDVGDGRAGVPRPTALRCDADLGPADILVARRMFAPVRYWLLVLQTVGAAAAALVLALLGEAPFTAAAAVVTLLGTLVMLYRPLGRWAPAPSPVQLDPEHVTIGGDDMTITLAWSAIGAVKRGHRVAALYDGAGRAVVVAPRRCFASEADADAFHEFADRHAGRLDVPPPR